MIPKFLKKNKLVTYDDPYIFEKKVEDSEIIKIHLEWMPFNNGEFENLILAIQKENSDSNFIENRGADSSISDDAQTIYRFQDSPIPTEIDLSYMRPLKREKVQEKFNAFHHRDELSAVSYDDALVLPGNNRKVVLSIATDNWWKSLEVPGLAVPMMWRTSKQSNMTKERSFFWVSMLLVRGGMHM